MTDIVLNTNAFRVLLEEDIINRVVEKCDSLYVANCAWGKELRGVYTQLTNTLYSSVRKLGTRFHQRKMRKIVLPQNLKKELLRFRADECDYQIAGLAFERHERSGQKVCLVSNDPCFQNPHDLFDKYGIDVKSVSKFREDY